MPEKVDFKKQLDCYRAARDRFRVLEVPPLRYLMIDGHGDPNTSGQFAEAVSALYPVAYKLKFASKQELGRDYVVMPLEGRWWAEDMASFTAARDKSRWQWTLMIMVPDWIGEDLFEAVVAKAAAGGAPAALDRVRLERLAEGTCVQTLHLGPFDEEAAVLQRMHREFIPAQGLRMTGEHHEIYLSDFRRVAPEKLRTILRQPVAAAD
ncbi:GyrI-like domain-containing protein [Sciscionella sediminilitoris]|uniref:GyrI-like domain-containing protein n=1 Tax=Sciscionella sediminilitoris TaxID=1445613 RepID=UPI0004DFB09A|nr:GyrI-like domain-containing protein [Sciscionella sp. SE31]